MPLTNCLLRLLITNVHDFNYDFECFGMGSKWATLRAQFVHVNRVLVQSVNAGSSSPIVDVEKHFLLGCCFGLKAEEVTAGDDDAIITTVVSVVGTFNKFLLVVGAFRRCSEFSMFVGSEFEYVLEIGVFFTVVFTFRLRLWPWTLFPLSTEEDPTLFWRWNCCRLMAPTIEERLVDNGENVNEAKDESKLSSASL